MIFCQASEESCNSLKKILLQYEEASGQQINKGKSSIFFSAKTSEERKEKIKTTQNNNRGRKREVSRLI